MKHKRNSEFISSKKTNIKKFIKSQSKLSELELQLGVFAACHTSIKLIDHLTESLKKNNLGTSSPATKILHLHRTKSTTLIKKVILPEFLKEQVAELKSSFSLIFDESTEKNLYLCVRYYNKKENKYYHYFLG